jgi:hypothetical protein
MKTALLLFILSVFIIFFQAQLPDGSNDNNPYIEQPTREAYSHFVPPHQFPEVVTINDYDNFDVNVDFYEQQVTSRGNYKAGSFASRLFLC